MIVLLWPDPTNNKITVDSGIGKAGSAEVQIFVPEGARIDLNGIPHCIIESPEGSPPGITYSTYVNTDESGWIPYPPVFFAPDVLEPASFEVKSTSDRIYRMTEEFTNMAVLSSVTEGSTKTSSIRHTNVWTRHEEWVAGSVWGFSIIGGGLFASCGVHGSESQASRFLLTLTFPEGLEISIDDVLDLNILNRSDGFIGPGAGAYGEIVLQFQTGQFKTGKSIALTTGPTFADLTLSSGQGLYRMRDITHGATTITSIQISGDCSNNKW